MGAVSPDEALEEAARLARERAPELCRRGAESCAWHHGLWPTLRLLELVTAPALHGAFLREALAALAGERPRVLLSGAADHALLAQALGALAGREPEVTVVDLCETPLMLNRWFAERAGARVVTRRSDILDLAGPHAFDAVCTHAFLGNFDAAGREALMRKWHALLVPGGKVITVNRLRPGCAPQWLAFGADQARAYRTRVEHAAQARGLRVAGLGDAAEAYAARQAIFPLGSDAELRALFERAGFVIEHLSVGKLEPAVRQKVDAPTVPGGAGYAHLIAAKR